MARGCGAAVVVWLLGAVLVTALGLDRGSWTGVPLVLVAGFVGIATARRRQGAPSAETVGPPADPSLPEDVWFERERSTHQSLRSQYFGPPEVQMQGALDMLEAGHVGAAMIFAQRSLNTLEDLFVHGKMERRTPSAADGELIAVLPRCVDAATEQGHMASARAVADAAFRNLQRCAEAAGDAGFDHTRYESGARELEKRFPGLDGRPSF